MRLHDLELCDHLGTRLLLKSQDTALHYIMQPHANTVYGECGDKATHIHNLSTRWMLLPSFTFSPSLLLGREVFWTAWK